MDLLEATHGFPDVVEGSLGAAVVRVGLLSLLCCTLRAVMDGFTRLDYFTGYSVVVLCIPLRGRVVILSGIFNFFLGSVSLMCFLALVSLYMRKVSNMFSILPVLLAWMIIISSIFPIACPFSRRSWANVDLLCFSLMCSWNLVLKVSWLVCKTMPFIRKVVNCAYTIWLQPRTYHSTTRLLTYTWLLNTHIYTGWSKRIVHLMITIQGCKFPPPVFRHVLTRLTVFSKAVFCIARSKSELFIEVHLQVSCVGIVRTHWVFHGVPYKIW